jgi:zinc protease
LIPENEEINSMKTHYIDDNIRKPNCISPKKSFGKHARRRFGFVPIWLMLLSAAVLIAMANSGAAESGDDGQKEVLRATLENGLRIIIVRNTLSPVVATMVNYLVGSNEAPEGFPGTAHAQEHMMFRGSPGLSADQLADIIAAMGGMFDADTQQMVTQYFFVVPAEDLDLALHIEAIRMRGVLDSEKLWAQERGAIEQEVAQDLSDPEYVFYTKLLAALFKGTPYAHDALGTRPSFDRTTGAMLKKFHDTWYAPNNAILVIVGNVDPQETLAEVKKLFQDVPARNLPERPEINLQPVTAETFKLKTDRPYGMVMISFRMPGYDSPDYAASEVLADVLSNQRNNLYALVTEGKALFTGFSLDTLPRAGLGYVIGILPKGADSSVLVEEIRKTLRAYIKDGFPADLVEAAKRIKLTKSELQKNSVLGQAMTWSQALAVEGRQSPRDNLKAIQKITVEDVNRVARKYLDLDHAIAGILTPEASGKPTSSAGFGGKESFAPQQTQTVKLPEWASRALKRLTVPSSTLQPVVLNLPNGLKLIVQPESVSKTVNVYGHVLNRPELQTPKGKEGVDQVLDQLFSYGTTSLNRLAYQKALDDIGARESAGVDFYLQVLTPYFDRGVQLLADNELHPALPEKAFKVVQQQVAATVAGQLQSPGYLASRAVDSGILPKNDPMLRQATPKTVSSLTLQDVKDYYQKVFRPDMTTIVVIGAVTPENARKVIEKYFGQWKATGPKPNTLLPPVPPNMSSVTVVPDTSRIQDKVTLAQSLELNRSNPDYYALQLGNHVLGGAFYATRLYRDLREKNGLVYYVSSSFDLGRTRGRYVVNYACDPSNVDKARVIIQENLREMQTEPMSPEELRQAAALLLREIPLSESSIDGIAQGMIDRVILDLPLNEPTLAAQHYIKLTAEQVRKAFSRWVRPDDLVEVTQGPQP